MQLQQFVDIKLGRLDNLRLSDIHILYREDPSRSFLNLPPNRLWHKLLHQLFQITARRLSTHDFKHLLPNLPNLRCLRIRRLRHLVCSSLGERNSEEADEVTIGSFHIDMGFDERLPFTDEGTEFVRSEIHAMEIG